MKEFFKKRRNKTFYLTLISQILVAVQAVLVLFGKGYLLDTVLQNKILVAANAVLVVLATLGVVNDPTTPGFKDKEE